MVTIFGRGRLATAIARHFEYNTTRKVFSYSDQKYRRGEMFNEVVCLATKDLGKHLEIINVLSEDKLVISFMADNTTENLSTYFPQCRNIIRTMPNLGIEFGETALPYCSKKEIEEDDLDILGLFGYPMKVSEKHFDVITKVNGSGPALVGEFLSSFKEVLHQTDLSSDDVDVLLRQLLRSTQLLLTRDSIEELQDRVTTPGGHTEKCLQELRKNNFGSLIKMTCNATNQV